MEIDLSSSARDNGTVDLDFSVKDLAGNVSDNVTQDNVDYHDNLPVIGAIVFVSNNAKSSPTHGSVIT